jgi:hypothetical protein
MEELVKLVSQKAGINEQQAQAAISTVLEFVKSKLPPQLASQVDGVISGKTDLSGLGGLGGLFGGR